MRNNTRNSSERRDSIAESNMTTQISSKKHMKYTKKDLLLKYLISSVPWDDAAFSSASSLRLRRVTL